MTSLVYDVSCSGDGDDGDNSDNGDDGGGGDDDA